MADKKYLEFIKNLDKNNKDIDNYLEDSFGKLVSQFEKVKEENKKTLKYSRDLRNSFIQNLELPSFKFNNEDMLSSSLSLEQKMSRKYFLSSKNNKLLIDSNKSLQSLEKIKILKIDKKLAIVNKSGLNDGNFNVKNSNKSGNPHNNREKIFQIDKELITPINIQKYIPANFYQNKNHYANDIPALGKDIILSFKKHFGNILLKNYKTYKFNRNLKVLLRKIKGVNLLLKIYSKVIMNIYKEKIVSKIKKIQSHFKFIYKKNRMMKLFDKTKSIVRSKYKFYLYKLKTKIKRGKIIMIKIKAKLSELIQNKFKKSKLIFNKILKRKDTTSMLASKMYHDTKMKIKILSLLISAYLSQSL